MGKEGRGRKAASGRAGGRAGGGGERGGGRRGKGRARRPRGFPASLARCAPRSLGRCWSCCSPPGSPRLSCPPWPRLLPPSGPALRCPLSLLRLRLLPHKYQLLNPSPDLAAAAAATLGSGSASRDFREGLGPPRLGPTRCPWLLAPPSRPIARPPTPRRGPAPLTQAPPDWGAAGAGGVVALTRAGWPPARDVSSAPPSPYGAPRRADPASRGATVTKPPPGARAAFGSGASALRLPPQEPANGPRDPGAR